MSPVADRYAVVVQPGVTPRRGAVESVGALAPHVGVAGGVVCTGPLRHYGWMLAPAPLSPLSFELVAVTSEADGPDPGPEIDVPAPGVVVVARELVRDALPDDPVVAMVALCARARAAGLHVECRRTLLADGAPDDADDRGRAAALRALAERYLELRAEHRIPFAWRSAFVDRELRLAGGRRIRTRVPAPPLTVLVHGSGAELAARRARELGTNVRTRPVVDPVRALAAELETRGDRLLVIAHADRVPDAAAFHALLERLESAPWVAMTAPDRRGLEGACVLIALSRLPQHVVPQGDALPEQLLSLASAAAGLRRAVLVPGWSAAPPSPRAAASATIVVAAGSLPEVLRVSLGVAVEAAGAGDALVAVCPANALTTRRIVGAYPQAAIVEDAGDPLLCEGVNRAIGAARTDIVFVIADDVLVPAASARRLRAAFARLPSLGAAFPAVPGAPGGEGVLDAQYADLDGLRALAAQRAESRAREVEPIDLAVTPAFAASRAALEAVGGIDPAHGPTRRGIADLVARMRAAGYAVVRCDDALAHRFEASVSQNPAAVADLQETVAVPSAETIARGFAPARRVPLVRHQDDAGAVAHRHVVALAVANELELQRAAAYVALAGRTLDARSPVRVDIVLDGEVASAAAAARMRSALAASGRDLRDTLAVRVERASDLGAWRATLDRTFELWVAPGHERDAFAGLPPIAANALAEIAQPVVR